MISNILLSCKKSDPIPTYSNSVNLIKPGDIIAVSTSGDSLILMDSNGGFKSILYALENPSDSIYGLNFKRDTKEIIFTINGAARVGAISVIDGTFRTLIHDVNLAGTLRGITQLLDGDILVIETSNVERFTSLGTRKTLVSGVTWPNTLGATAAPEQIETTANGEIIICGSANVNRFTSNAVRVGVAVVSSIAGTLAGNGCIEMSNGTIAVAFNGTTDTIKTVSSTMIQATSQSLYTDLGRLASPRWLSQTLNGNLLTVDSGFNEIVEITAAGSFVRTLGSGLIGVPNAVFSVPNY